MGINIRTWLPLTADRNLHKKFRQGFIAAPHLFKTYKAVNCK